MPPWIFFNCERKIRERINPSKLEGKTVDILQFTPVDNFFVKSDFDF